MAKIKHIPFGFGEFLITRAKTLTVELANKIMWYHIVPMLKVREELGVSMTASNYSGYRPKWWELRKKRSGKSQHVFNHIGAVDWTCADFKNNRDEFLRLIIEHTEYTRICIYDNFIHCDYKPTPADKRRIYKMDYDNLEWKFIKNAA